MAAVLTKFMDLVSLPMLSAKFSAGRHVKGVDPKSWQLFV